VSQLSDFRHPFDAPRHPTLEPEVKRAIFATWAAERAAPGGKRGPGQRSGACRQPAGQP